MDSDRQRLAEVEKVEALIVSNLDEARSEEVREAALRAVATLLELSVPDAGAVLARVDKLLDFAATGAPTEGPYIAWLRAQAYIRAGSADVALDPRQTLEVIWRAFEANAGATDATITAGLGLAFGHFSIHYYGAPDAPFPIERADRGLTVAHAHYLDQGYAAAAAGAAFLLAQVKMRLIRTGGLAREDLVSTHDAAGDLISEAIAESDPAHGDEWACRHKVAVDIAFARPGQLLSDNLDQALKLYDQALAGYTEVGDQALAAQCAIAALEKIDEADVPATPARAKLSERILLYLEWAYTGTWGAELQMVPTLERSASMWLAAAHNSDGEEAEDTFEQARRCAQALTTLPIEPDFAQARMIGYFIFGNALGEKVLTASVFELLQAAEAEEVRARLVAARGAFGSAREIARRIGAELYGRISIQYAKTLSAQIACCGDESLIAEAIAAWRQAVQATADDERTRSQLNLVNVLLQAVSTRKLDYLSELDQMLEDLAADANVQRNQDLRAALETLTMLRQKLDEAMLEQARTSVADLWDLRNEAGDVEEALRIASGVESRRQRLAEVVTSGPTYSLARDLMFGEPYNLILKDLELMIDRGVPEDDPALWQRAVAQAKFNHELMEEVIKDDRQKTSSEGGKALLAAHLQRGLPFVLLLRAFELEARASEVPASWFEDQGRAGFTGETMRISRSPGEGAIGRLSELLSPYTPTLMIVNVDYAFAPPADAAVLFLRPQEWHAIVFCLIAVAKAVVLILPREAEWLSSGVSDEVRAIRELGATSKTVIVFDPKLRTLFEYGDDAAPTMTTPALRSWLEEQGFRQAFDTDKAFGSAGNVVQAIRTLLDSSEPAVGRAGDHFPE